MVRVPAILIVAPPAIRPPRGTIAPKFAGGDAKCFGVADAYREVAVSSSCSFLDAGTVVSASEIDGVHLDAEAHAGLGAALEDVVRPLLSPIV